MSLRVAQVEDAEGILAIYAPLVEASPVTFETEVPSLEEMAARLESRLPQYPWLVWEEAGRILGYAYGGSWRGRHAYRFNVEVSVYVHAEAQRRGLGKILYSALLRTLQLQGFGVAYGGVTLPNAGSLALHEGLGFERVGHWHAAGYKAETWHDVGWWARALNDWQPIPTDPTDFSEFREEEAFAEVLATASAQQIEVAPAGQRIWERHWQPPEDPPAIVNDKLEWVDARHRRVQRLGSFIGSAVLFVGAAVYCGLSYFLNWVDTDVWPYSSALAIAGALLLGVFNDRYAVWHYNSYRYRLGRDALEIHKGVWWRSRTTVPKSRVQHTDVAQGPIQRRFGLATLSVHTAGTAEDSVELSGLAHELALEIRDYLIPKGASDAV